MTRSEFIRIFDPENERDQDLIYIYFQPLRRKRRTSPLLILSVITVFFLLHGCQKKGKDDNVILITLDTQRADFISSYRSDNALTPNIDDLAHRGILYENCYSLIPITLPSHASIFFSEPPYVLKNYNNGQLLGKRRKKPSFVNIFKKQGYITGAVVSLGVLKSRFGLDEGFYTYEDNFPKGRWYLTAEEVNERVLPWLEQNKDQKFFLWIHYSDPHEPYAPPDIPDDLSVYMNDQLLGEYCLGKYVTYEIDLELGKGENRLRFEINNIHQENPEDVQARFDKLNIVTSEKEKIDIRFSEGWSDSGKGDVLLSKKVSVCSVLNDSHSRPVKFSFRGKLVLPVNAARALYKKEVEYMDEQIGKLWTILEDLELFEKTHILMVGDHGEGLGEYMIRPGNPHLGHIHFLYDAYMRVPLIIHNPHRKNKGRKEKVPVTLLDIAPTIMESVGLQELSHFQGRSLLGLEQGDEKISIFQETYKPEAIKERFALLHHPWHLIITPEDKTYELFNLREDPEEKKNIYEKKALPPDVWGLKKSLDSFARKALEEKLEIKIDDKSKEMLRALGYIR